jgi:protein-disulfide isomerase
MAKTETPKKRKRKNSNNLAVILIIAAFAVVVVVLIIVSQQSNKVEVVLPNLPAKPQPSGMNLGDPNAPVKVIEFADFQCTVCHQYWLQMESSILDTYVATGKVYYTFANFAFFGKESSDAAAAAYCANDQGKFWEYHDVIFANYKGENVGGFVPANLKAFAEKLGLDMTKFNACFDSGQYAQKVIDDATYARSNNVTGTPSFLVNGKLVYASDLTATIDAALAGK